MPIGLGLGVSPILRPRVLGVSVPDLPTTGLISEWRFDEGSGNDVFDQVGSNDIDLTTPTTPNTTWTSEGITTASGLVQTPSITNSRTIVALVKSDRHDAGAGFYISGGASSGNGSTTGFAQNTDTWHTGFAGGVSPVRARSSGQGVEQFDHGGWHLQFRELDIQRTSVYGFLGRHSTTTSRLANGAIAWAAIWSTALTDQDRQDIYDHVRNLVKSRGVYFDYRDPPTTYNCQILFGQSNADGRALITNLSAGDQANTTPNNVFISSHNSTSDDVSTVDALDMGVNQQDTDPVNDFGPEMGAAWEWEDNEGASGSVLAIFKVAAGSTYLAPSSETEVSSSSVTWSTDELATGGLFQLGLMKKWQQFAAELLNNDIGPYLRGVWIHLGENDSLSQNTSGYWNDTAPLMTDVLDELKTHCGFTTFHTVIARIYDSSPSDATAYAEVRDGQDALDTNNTDITTFSIDDLTFLDTVHLDAAGMKTCGERFYANKGW